jgi:hypothetical protein
MDLSKTVACTALLLIIVLSAGHALAQMQAPRPDESKTCVIKPVMSDAEIEVCRVAYRRR